jgi:hypothetical protein
MTEQDVLGFVKERRLGPLNRERAIDEDHPVVVDVLREAIPEWDFGN